MEKKLVSVVMCTYNGERYLEQQIDSILSQNYQLLELIISDDCSTDNTINILEKYKANPVCRIFYQEKNMGLIKNFAFAASQAKGDLVSFSDQDDIWLENKIEKLAGAIGENPLVYSDSLLVDEDGNSLGKKMSDIRSMYSGNDSRGYIFYSCVSGHGMMVKKELLEKSLPLLNQVQHDFWITFHAFLNGGIHYYDEVLTHFRRHTSSITQVISQKQAARKQSKRYEDYLKKLEWIRLMKEHEREEYQSFYNKLAELYFLKSKRLYVWPLVFFMLKHRKSLYLLSKKSFLSQLIFILKQGRGEKR